MKVCIIGTGYVGLVSAACFAEMGNEVYCVDVNPKVIEGLRKGEVHIYEPGLEPLVAKNFNEQRLIFTTELKEGLAAAQLVFICVGTPSNNDGSCDLSYVENVASQIGKLISAPIVVINKSTVPVGTASLVSQIISAELQKRALPLDFDVVSNPEFLKEGDAIQDFMKPDRVIIGTSNEASAELLRELYSPFARSREKIIVMSVKSAEMTKYAANCMLATKISFINEIANLCEEVGADVRDVRLGIGADQRIGYHFIYPGLGYGGSCFPKDVKALIHTAHKNNFKPELLESVDAVNKRQKVRMAHRISKYFNDKLSTSVKGKTLALWGLAFKANTDDIRDAASLAIIEELTKQGMKVQAFDPVASANAKNALAANPLVEICKGQYDVLKNADALLVVTEWNQFRTPDFKRIKEALNNPLIFDGRNLYAHQTLEKLGFTYISVGKQ